MERRKSARGVACLLLQRILERPFELCQAESFGNSFLTYRSSTQNQPYLPCGRIAAETLRPYL
jgi:hypothetical protein